MSTIYKNGTYYGQAGNPMPSTDMEEVLSPLPGVMNRRMKYSTDEQIVGEWIDGKPIYQKTVNFEHGYDSNGRITKTLANMGISNLSKFIYMGGIALASGGAAIPVPTTQSSSEIIGLYYAPSVTSVIVYCTTASWRDRDVYITFRYTKTTD